MLASISTEGVLQAVDLATDMYKNKDIPLKVDAYEDKNVSTKVVKIIQSYTSVVNKMVWRK